MPQRIASIGHGLHGKALLRQRFRHPLGDEELVLDEEDADRLGLC